MHVPLFPLCYFFVTNFVYPLPLPWWRHKQYSFGLVFSRNAKKTHGDQSMPKIFHSVWKETTHKSSKVVATKSIFSTDTTYFDQCFLFHAITGRHYFLYKFNVTLSFFFSTAMLLRSLKQLLERSSCYKSVILATTLQC